jgi:hypothetical protein
MEILFYNSNKTTCPTIPYKTHKQKEEDNQKECCTALFSSCRLKKVGCGTIQMMPCRYYLAIKESYNLLILHISREPLISKESLKKTHVPPVTATRHMPSVQTEISSKLLIKKVMVSK